MTERINLARDDVELACFELGGSGPAALLLHGLAGHSGEWKRTAAWLASSRRVVAFDQRAHGHSTRRPADVSPQARLEDAAAVIERLGLAPAVLIGQSLGGHLAIMLARARPELVSALVVAEAHPAADPQGRAAAAVAAWLSRWPVPFPSRKAAVEYFGGPSLFASAWVDGLERRAGGWWPRFEPELMVRTVREQLALDHTADWDELRCPVLLVRAGAGFFDAQTLHALAARLPAARYEEVPEAAHDLHLDRPLAWRAAVEPFLRSLHRSPVPAAP